MSMSLVSLIFSSVREEPAFRRRWWETQLSFSSFGPENMQRVQKPAHGNEQAGIRVGEC